MRLDIEALRVLDVVIQEGSFAKAAAKLHKAQSAVSYQIKKLEQQFDVPIFDRSSYRAELTPQGRVLWQEGRQLLQQAIRIENLADHYSKGWEPTFELVIDGALPLEPVMRAMKALAEKEIPTKIQIKVEALGGVQMRFDQDEANMMLVVDYTPSPKLNAIPLPEVPMILVTSKDHCLAQQKEVDLNQLLNYVELTIHDTSELPTSKRDSLQFGGDKVFYLHGFDSKKTCLLMGLGYGWMPLSLIETELACGELVEVDYTNSRHAFTPKLVYSAELPLGKAGELILNEVISEFEAFSH